MTKKQCSHCNTYKELAQFYNDKQAHDGKQNVCRKCKKDLKVNARQRNKAKKMQALVKATEANGGDMIGAYLETQPVKDRRSAATGLQQFLNTLTEAEGDKLEKLAYSDEANEYIMKYLRLAEEVADRDGDLKPMAHAVEKVLMKPKAQKIDIPQIGQKDNKDLLASIDALLEGKKEEETDD